MALTAAEDIGTYSSPHHSKVTQPSTPAPHPAKKKATIPFSLSAQEVYEHSFI